MTYDQLIRVAGNVNLRIHRGSALNNDALLLVELMKEDILESQLGEADLGEDCWIWRPLPRTCFIQYASGRCAVVRSKPVSYPGIPLSEAIA